MESTATRATAGMFAAAAIVTALVAGCSGSGSADHGSGPAAAPAVTPSAPVIKNDPKARPAVAMQTCKPSSAGAGWSAGGTVTNQKAESATYTIVVSFTTKQSTVLARGTTQVKLKAGQTKDWSTDANFAKTKDAQCVLRGVSEQG